jgi:hypothetical protein
MISGVVHTPSRVSGCDLCNFGIYFVKKSDKIKHPNFQTLVHNCQSSGLKRAYEVPLIFWQGHCSQENGGTSAKNQACPVV